MSQIVEIVASRQASPNQPAATAAPAAMPVINANQVTPFAVIQHTLAGEGRLSYEGRQLPLGPGETMLVTIPHEHRYFLPPGGHWRFFYLVLQGREALRPTRQRAAEPSGVLTSARRLIRPVAGKPANRLNRHGGNAHGICSDGPGSRGRRIGGSWQAHADLGEGGADVRAR